MTDEPYLVTTKAHMSSVIELHELCFISDEQQNLHYALLDENCFSFLGGCDEDGQPTGYTVVRVQGKEAEGLWLGVRADRLNLKRNRSRKKGLGRTLMLTAMNEARSRGAEYASIYVSDVNPTSAITIKIHKKEGFELFKSSPDSYINDDGKRVDFTIHNLRMSLMSIANRNDYDKKIFTCDGEGTHSKVHFQYTPKISNVRPLVDGKLTAVCPQCDRDVIYNG